MSDGVEIKIKGKIFNVSIDGLTPLEIMNIAKKIEDEMDKIESERGIVDTYKQMVLVSLNYAAESYLKEKNAKILKEADTSKLDNIIKKMKKNLNEETLF